MLRIPRRNQIVCFHVKEMSINEFIFDGFMVITLGSFGIASVDKYITSKKN